MSAQSSLNKDQMLMLEGVDSDYQPYIKPNTSHSTAQIGINRRGIQHVRGELAKLKKPAPTPAAPKERAVVGSKARNG
jgi:hypothetical protein